MVLITTGVIMLWGLRWGPPVQGDYTIGVAGLPGFLIGSGLGPESPKSKVSSEGIICATSKNPPVRHDSL